MSDGVYREAGRRGGNTPNGTPNPIPSIQEDHIMQSTTLKLTLTAIESERVRATIADGDSGVYAEALDAQTAAGLVVKSFLALNPGALTLKLQAKPYPSVRVAISRPGIERMLAVATDRGESVLIDYQDNEGHITTRTIEPKSMGSDRVVAFDLLRQDIRAFRFDRISSAQTV